MAGFDFEKSLTRLKNIVDEMEKQDSSLDQSLKYYSEGIKLYQQCTEFLEKARRKVELLKNGKALSEDSSVKADTTLFQDVD